MSSGSGIAPADRDLAAQLIDAGILAPEVVLAAVDQVSREGGDLGAQLIAGGWIDSVALAALRATRGEPRPGKHLGEVELRHTTAGLVRDNEDLRTARPAPAGATEGAPPARAPRRAAIEVPLETVIGPVSAAGRRPAERYLFLGEIGRGGMGRVFKGLDVEIGREVAIKVLIAKDAPDRELDRFWREVQVTGQLEHPGIAPIYDVGRLPSGELFVVMKLLRGRSLHDALDDGTEDGLLEAFAGAADAIAYAHSRGVVHRDLKPSNIWIDDRGGGLVLDFGLARVFGTVETREPQIRLDGRPAESLAGTITGTPQYIAPESITGEAGPPADVYGLGTVLYEILARGPLYADQPMEAVLAEVERGRIVPPSQRSGFAVDGRLERLCLATLVRDPAARPSAAAVAEALRGVLTGLREGTPPDLAGRIERLAQLSREREERSAALESARAALDPGAALEQKRTLWALEDRLRENFEQAEAALAEACATLVPPRAVRPSLSIPPAAARGRPSRAPRSSPPEGRRVSELRALFALGRSLLPAGSIRRFVDRFAAALDPALASGEDQARLELFAVPEIGPFQLERFTARDRLLVAEPVTAIEPGAPKTLAAGSYRLRAGPVRLPFVLAAGEVRRLRVTVPAPGALAPQMIYVAAGPVRLGGDPLAPGAGPAETAELLDFALGREPVTFAQYLRFLAALNEQDPRAALRRVPRARAGSGAYFRRDPALGIWTTAEGAGPRFTLDCPVFGVSFEDAEAYAEWYGASVGFALRLPREDEWEKAARGADGRVFPWGDNFDPAFCKMKDSEPGPPEPAPVGQFVSDQSPYGIADLAGGVRELCLGREGSSAVMMRGGSWQDGALFCRAAFRHSVRADFVHSALGFRLAQTLP